MAHSGHSLVWEYWLHGGPGSLFSGRLVASVTGNAIGEQCLIVSHCRDASNIENCLAQGHDPC